MKKFWFLLLLLVLWSGSVFGADTTRLYRPLANAERDIAALLQRARTENKNLLLQVGGNWCVACYRLNAVLQLTPPLRLLLQKNYLVYHLNYSKENKNLPTLNRLGNPQRFGFPVLLVLNAGGDLLHTQDSGRLQKGNGYDEEKIRRFLEQWAPAAVATIPSNTQ